jgi:hypothetical protein
MKRSTALSRADIFMLDPTRARQAAELTFRRLRGTIERDAFQVNVSLPDSFAAQLLLFSFVPLALNFKILDLIMPYRSLLR